CRGARASDRGVFAAPARVLQMISRWRGTVMGSEPALPEPGTGPSSIEGISAVTLATHDMARAVHCCLMLGFPSGHDTSLTAASDPPRVAGPGPRRRCSHSSRQVLGPEPDFFKLCDVWRNAANLQAP